jgi:CheY-like chemotaxis protein
LQDTVKHLVTADPARLTREDRRAVRHDLRAAAGYIVSACEDLEESLSAEFRKALDPELTETHQRAQRIIGHIEAVVQYGQETAHDGERIQQAIRKLQDKVARTNEIADRTEPGRILLVDDNEYNRELVGRMLMSLGHTVEMAEGGRAAQERLQQPDADRIDVILLDMIMPDITGLDLLDWIKQSPGLWHVPVIMVSALGDEEGVLACIAAGAEDYLTRPLRKELLRARISACLEQKRLRDREQAYLARIDRLVRAIFPPAAVTEWRETDTIKPRRHEKVGVLFLDVVGFTAWCETHREHPEKIVDTLQELVARMEETARVHGVQKIKTIGDAFMAVAGMAEPDPNPALTLLRCGRDLIRDVQSHATGWNVRIGIHIGPVVTGVLGQTQFSFDVWGHTVNAAARTESNGLPGHVSLSEEAYHEVQAFVTATPRDVQARGLGIWRIWDVQSE